MLGDLLDEKRNEIARDVSDNWRFGNDDDFYCQVRDNVWQILCNDFKELSSNQRDIEYKIIMVLIEEKYIHNNWKARELFEKTNMIFVDKRRLEINDIVFEKGNDIFKIELYDNKLWLENINMETIAIVPFDKIINIKIGEDNGRV